jgi:hypothetical protein
VAGDLRARNPPPDAEEWKGRENKGDPAFDPGTEEE